LPRVAGCDWAVLAQHARMLTPDHLGWELGVPKWVTPEFFEESRTVWSGQYGYRLSDEELADLLRNVDQLFDLLSEPPRDSRDTAARTKDQSKQ
jgi:hypothetical protein